VGYGIVQLVSGSSAGLIAVVFGCLGSVFTVRDLRHFVRPPADRHAWWFLHMSNMLGAYIAAVSTFSAVNFNFLPDLIRWTWPTVVGTVGIVIWTAYYRRKFDSNGRDRPSAARGPASPSAYQRNTMVKDGEMVRR
jgi:hypothetical protein